MSRSYAGQAAEDRVAERRNRLLEAGIEVVGTKGVAALGMRAVCREAGLSQKFFYESFADIDALLQSVYRAALSRLEVAVTPALRAGDPASVFDAAARLMEEDPRICRILLVEPVADARLRRHVREATPEIAVAVLGEQLVGSTEDPAVRMRFSALFGALISLFIEWTEGNLGTDRTAFVDHVTGVTGQLLRGTAQGG